MSNSNPFVKDPSHYKRDINFLYHYQEQSAAYLARMRGISKEAAREFIRAQLKPGGPRAFKDTPLRHTYRDPETGDREVRVSGLYRYIREAVQNNDIIAPTLTRYMNPKVRKSPLVDSIDKNVAKRNENKRIMFEASMRGDKNLEIAKDAEQTGNKLSNNALSGAHVSASTPLFNKTAHSSLTSTCRITSGYGNANNERIVAGNRHYYNYHVVLNNITSIIENTDYEKLAAVMEKYKLHYPSQDEVFAMIYRSASQYVRGKKTYTKIKEYLAVLNPLELAAVLYTGDLYHLKEYNDAFMRTFIGKLARRITEPHPDPESVISRVDDDYISIANQLQGEAMRGIGLRDAKGTELYGQVAATIVNIENVLDEYRDFIDVFMVSYNVPPSLGYFPSSIRHTALMSDTDSTIFTVQEWVKWYRGDYILDEQGIAVMAVVVFIASQAITHILAIMSANLGVEESRLNQIAMKNEFRFDVFIPTKEAKHYYAIIGCREGNVFKDYNQEIKGVHLRSSNVPAKVMNDAAALMREICEAIARGEKISINKKLRAVQAYELEIIENVRSGKSDYFRSNQIKTADSYRKDPTSSPYSYYTLWRDVFAEKYGTCEEPPYMAVKINTTLSSDNQFKHWLDSMQDQALAQRFRDWCERNNKRSIRTFYLPRNLIEANGIPPEIFALIDKRRIIADNMMVFYKILETLSFHALDSKITTLISDYSDVT